MNIMPPFAFKGIESPKFAALVPIPTSNSVSVDEGDFEVTSSKPDIVCP
jgi:hypothetical protein